jgi:hypothetical protein
LRTTRSKQSKQSGTGPSSADPQGAAATVSPDRKSLALGHTSLPEPQIVGQSLASLTESAQIVGQFIKSHELLELIARSCLVDTIQAAANVENHPAVGG